jgi:hypothetical protein
MVGDAAAGISLTCIRLGSDGRDIWVGIPHQHLTV